MSFKVACHFNNMLRWRAYIARGSRIGANLVVLPREYFQEVYGK